MKQLRFADDCLEIFIEHVTLLEPCNLYGHYAPISSLSKDDIKKWYFDDFITIEIERGKEKSVIVGKEREKRAKAEAEAERKKIRERKKREKARKDLYAKRCLCPNDYETFRYLSGDQCDRCKRLGENRSLPLRFRVGSYYYRMFSKPIPEELLCYALSRESKALYADPDIMKLLEESFEDECF